VRRWEVAWIAGNKLAGRKLLINALSGADLDAARLSGRRMYPDVALPHQRFVAEAAQIFAERFGARCCRH
jgi:hypothetical protein